LPTFTARKFCLKFSVKFTLSLWHIIGKKHKNAYLSLYVMKIQKKLSKPQNHPYIYKKTCNMRAQTQWLVSFFLSAWTVNYWPSTLLQNASKYQRIEKWIRGDNYSTIVAVLALL
jgi:hypothetical protein